MASFVDVTLLAGVWTNVTSAVGASTGDDLIVQNLSGNIIRVEERLAAPPNDGFGWEVARKSGVTSAPTAGNSVWAISLNANAKIHVEPVS